MCVLQVYHQMQACAGCAPDHHTFAALMKILHATQHWEQASGGGLVGWVGGLAGVPLRQQRARQQQPAPPLCTPHLPRPVCLPPPHTSVQVLAVHEVMLSQGLAPDTPTATLVLGAAVAAGQVCVGLGLYRQCCACVCGR